MSTDAEQPPRKWRQRLWVRIGAIVLVLWLAASLSATALQRKLIYYPDRAIVTPAEAGLVGVEEVQIVTADNEKLRAFYRPPAAGQPIILFFDGNRGRLQAAKPRYELMEKQSAGFLAIAYRGYSGSTGAPTEAGLIEDGRAAYRWLAARYRPDQIVVHGYSLGSGVAVRVAAENPVRALILEAPYDALIDVAAYRYPWSPARLVLWDRYLSRDYIAKVSAPILIVHGEKDFAIPISQGRALFARAHEPKRFVPIPGAAHINLYRYGLYGQIWKFLADYPSAKTHAEAD